MAFRAGGHDPRGRLGARSAHDKWGAVGDNGATRDQSPAIELKDAGTVGHQQLVGFDGSEIELIGAAPKV